MPIEEILEAYGVTDAKLLPMQKGYRNESHAAITVGGSRVNVIIYKRESDILTTLKKANLVGDYLASQGLPARRTSDSRILRLSSTTQVRYAAFYEYLPGETIPWEAYTMEHIKLLGSTMSTMHRSLKYASFILENNVTDEYRVIVKRMQDYFVNGKVQEAMADKLHLYVDDIDYFGDLLMGCSKLPDQQILHMDFVRGNVLFDTTPSITGIIDFEKAAWGHPLFDIARTLAFLLVDCKHKTEKQVGKYFLSSGYNKRGAGSFKLTKTNEVLLERLVSLFLIYDFYKFLLHNPYESLNENEHFVRTKDILLERKLIASV